MLPSLTPRAIKGPLSPGVVNAAFAALCLTLGDRYHHKREEGLAALAVACVSS